MNKRDDRYGETRPDQDGADEVEGYEVEGYEDHRSATAKAVDIASRLITVSLCLVLPIVGGFYLDQQFGTVALFVVLGLLFGMAASGWQMMKMLAPGGILSDEPSVPKADETDSVDR